MRLTMIAAAFASLLMTSTLHAQAVDQPKGMAVWDTNKPAGLLVWPTELGKSQWTVLAGKTVDSFSGDAVLSNGRIVVVLRKQDCRGRGSCGQARHRCPAAAAAAC